MTNLIKKTGYFCKIKRFAIVEIQSAVIMSDNPMEALRQFDESIDYDGMLRNAAGEDGIITSIEWTEKNNGVEIETLDPNTLRPISKLCIEEDRVEEFKDFLSKDGIN